MQTLFTISLNQAFCLTSIIAIFCIMVTQYYKIIYRQKIAASDSTPFTTKQTYITITCSIIATVAVITTLILFCIFLIAQRHGMQIETINKPIKEIIHSINNSPTEDNLPKNITGCIILYYKFGCSDCEDIYHELQTEIKNKENIYWVSTQSTQGKELLKSYPVDEVPSGIYIRYDSLNGLTTYTKKQLYQVYNENGIATLNHTNLNRLLQLKSEKR